MPSSDTYIAKDANINEHIEQMRLSATKALIESSDTIVVASVSSIYGLGDPRSYLKMILNLSRGEIVNQREILRKLSTMQYTRNDLDFQRSNFRVRGNVIDIFPAEAEKEAVRIELEIDKVHYDINNVITKQRADVTRAYFNFGSILRQASSNP